MKKLSLLFLVVLAACVPSTQVYPPDTPIFYPTAYRNLFDATLQELTAAYVPDQLERRTFAITQADLETGLITAVRNERESKAALTYRSRWDEDGFPFGLFFAVPLERSQPEQTLITIVVRPAGDGSSLIYSTQGPNGTTSLDATRLMRQVTANLDARFRPVAAPQALKPQTSAPQPATPDADAPTSPATEPESGSEGQDAK